MMKRKSLSYPRPQSPTSSPWRQLLLPISSSAAVVCIQMPIYNHHFPHQWKHTRHTVLHLHTLFLALNSLIAVEYRQLILRVLMKNSPLKLVATTV